MNDKEISDKIELLKEAEDIVNQIYSAWENPTASVYGNAARVWNMIKTWNIDADNKLMQKDNKGRLVSLVAMIISIEKETIKMCMSSKGKKSIKGSKWEKIISKNLTNSSQI
jgi:hypothetical protein